MNEHTPPTERATTLVSRSRLQALDLDALGIGDASDQLLACDIDDPDCELPGAVDSTAAGETDANEG